MHEEILKLLYPDGSIYDQIPVDILTGYNEQGKQYIVHPEELAKTLHNTFLINAKIGGSVEDYRNLGELQYYLYEMALEDDDFEVDARQEFLISAADNLETAILAEEESSWEDYHMLAKAGFFLLDYIEDEDKGKGYERVISVYEEIVEKFGEEQDHFLLGQVHYDHGDFLMSQNEKKQAYEAARFHIDKSYEMDPRNGTLEILNDIEEALLYI